jgi:plasmid maintenance system antidote protein VapI
MATTKLAPIHPGEVLLEEFLEPLEISQYRLAKDISVSPRRINEIVHGLRAITARYGAPPRSVLWHLRAVLAQLADTL